MNARKLTGCLFLIYFLFVAHHTHALELNGVASFRELGSEVYLGALHLDSRTSDLNAIFADNREKKMEIRFSQSMSKRRWAGNWMQSIAINNNRDSLVSAAEELSEILSAFADNLDPGDTVAFHYLPGNGTAITINGTTLAQGKSAAIFNLFLSAWVGAVPPSSQFKNALLGTVDSGAEQSRFAAIQPSQERIDAVKTWGGEEEEVVEEEVVEEAVEEEAAEEVAGEMPVPPGPAKEDLKPEPGEVKLDAPVAAVAEAPAAAPTEESKPEPAAPEPTPVAATAPAPQVAVDNETEIDLSVESILAQQAYASDLIRKIYQKVKYPAAAVKRNHEGSVRVSLVVARDGSLGSLNITEESQYSSLNKEALRAIESASPFSALPSSISDDNMEIVVPITFKLAE